MHLDVSVWWLYALLVRVDAMISLCLALYNKHIIKNTWFFITMTVYLIDLRINLNWLYETQQKIICVEASWALLWSIDLSASVYEFLKGFWQYINMFGWGDLGAGVNSFHKRIYTAALHYGMSMQGCLWIMTTANVHCGLSLYYFTSRQNISTTTNLQDELEQNSVQNFMLTKL